VIDSGSTTLIADGTFTTNQAQPTELGCYTWTASLAVEIIPGTPSTVTSEAGIESETFLVEPVPTLPRTGSQPIVYALSAIAFMALGLALMGWSRRLRRA
jgi:LPXTG-motif cell wall-anchored protein